MLKTKTITTDKTTVLVVELPYNATSPKYVDEGHGARLVCNNTSTANGSILVHLPQGNWQLLGRLPDITEEQAESVLPNYYHNHIRSFAKWYWALLFDFLKDNDVYFENPLGKKPVQSEFYWGFLHDLGKWHEAQSKVFDKERCYLFIKVD